LPVRQPVAPFESGVLQHDADVLELAVQVRPGCEAEAEPHQLGGFGVEVEGSDHEGQVEVARAHLDLADQHLPPGGSDGERIAQRVVVERETCRRERVRHVAHLVAFADPDDVAEIVGDDPQVIAVVLDVGRKVGAVAPAADDLLAPVGGLPIHFDRQLVGFDQSRWLGQPRADLREKEHEPVGPGAVAPERSIGPRLEPALHRPLHQRARLGRIPGLSGERRGRGDDQGGRGAGHARESGVPAPRLPTAHPLTSRPPGSR
jgi:hypothetical protein